MMYSLWGRTDFHESNWKTTMVKDIRPAAKAAKVETEKHVKLMKRKDGGRYRNLYNFNAGSIFCLIFYCFVLCFLREIKVVRVCCTFLHRARRAWLKKTKFSSQRDIIATIFWIPPTSSEVHERPFTLKFPNVLIWRKLNIVFCFPYNPLIHMINKISSPCFTIFVRTSESIKSMRSFSRVHHRMTILKLQIFVTKIVKPTIAVEAQVYLMGVSIDKPDRHVLPVTNMVAKVGIAPCTPKIWNMNTNTYVFASIVWEEKIIHKIYYLKVLVSQSFWNCNRVDRHPPRFLAV
mmetsp:Transcript_1558/g.1953  ORF Transcript_1558/g.1953 Transcript_1558/m.1953 type:complete len:291 (+) Transcript_1558:73-945(+)